MNKDRQIISELHNYFTESGCGPGIQRIMNVLMTINITKRQKAFEKKPNCKFTYSQVIQMMILFPFFSIKNAANYCGSILHSIFDCHKDMFYRVLSNDSYYPICMIVDDTDMPKTDRRGEMLVDFTLQGEEGRIASRPQGLSKRDIDARFNKERNPESIAQRRFWGSLQMNS